MNQPRPSIAQIKRTRHRELRALSKRLQDAETKVQLARADLDRRLFMFHEDGMTIADLSTSSGLSRETVYKAISRVKTDLEEGR